MGSLLFGKVLCARTKKEWNKIDVREVTLALRAGLDLGVSGLTWFYRLLSLTRTTEVGEKEGLVSNLIVPWTTERESWGTQSQFVWHNCVRNYCMVQQYSGFWADCRNYTEQEESINWSKVFRRGQIDLLRQITLISHLISNWPFWFRVLCILTVLALGFIFTLKFVFFVLFCHVCFCFPFIFCS